MAQKRTIKRQYAKAKRDAQRANKAVKGAVSNTKKIITKLISAVIRHPHALIIVVALFLLVIIISSIATSCSAIVSGFGSSITAANYLAEDADINAAGVQYTELATDLRLEIMAAETNYPGYDDYRYLTGSITKDQYEIMAFLTAVYKDFSSSAVEGVIQQVFNDRYQLSYIPSEETHYRDPFDLDDDGDYEPYNVQILTVKLTTQSFTDAVSSRMDAEQAEHYGLLLRSKGNRQYVSSPLGFNWLYHITDYYGYRVHPITGEKNYHKGVDIGIPEGTEIIAAHDGVVTFSGYSGDYGNVVVISGSNGIVTKYAHCYSLSVTEDQAVTAGEVIALSGNTGVSNGPHLHFEVLKNGLYMNPVYFALSN